VNDLNELTPQALRRVRWVESRRPEQIPPAGDWLVWLIQTGRGWGKTRTGAEWVAEQAVDQPGTRWAVVAPTIGDARDVCIEGQSGLLQALAPNKVENWNRSMGELKLGNGSKVHTFSGEVPDRLRGPQFHGAWCDELAAWPRLQDTWDNLQMGLRLGDRPRLTVTTTPRPRPVIRDLVSRDDGTVHLTSGSTFDNADNLPSSALDELRRRYEGSRLGRQELLGELIEDVAGALWTVDTIASTRLDRYPELQRIVVGVDPATSGRGDETGIVVCGRAMIGDEWHGFVLDDRSLLEHPEVWRNKVAEAYMDWNASAVIPETNRLGGTVETLIRDAPALKGQPVQIIPVVASSVTGGKGMRADPVAAAWAQGRCHMVGAGFQELESQMVSWVPGDSRSGSPDRLDALVWAMTHLLVDLPGEPPRPVSKVGFSSTARGETPKFIRP